MRCNIVDVIGSYMVLKRAGSNYSGSCPFHNEKTPSFTVFTRSDSFYCFGCGAGGDVITFIMKAENVDYPSAVEILAKRCGMELPVGEDVLAESNKRKRILAMNVAAAKFYRSELASGKYPEATAYVKQRGLDGPAAKKYGIGYAPDSYGVLAKHLSSLGFTMTEMKEGFLCDIARNGKPYDYYRDRIIFPIIDTLGNVIAFGGRAMSKDVKNKYLNSTDTPAFKKRRNLFSLNYAKNSPDDFFILCEGYTDVIALYKAGITCAVASLGTALTDEQASVMKKYKSKVIICYDGDAAGKKATKRAIGVLSQAGLEIKVLSLPEGLDPDEFLKKYGAERFRRLINESGGEFEYQAEEIYSKYDIESTEGKLKAAGEVCQLLASVHSDVRRGVYINDVSKRLQIPAENIKRDVDRMRSRDQKRSEKEEVGRIIQQTAGYADAVNPDRARDPGACRAEETVLGMMLFEPAYIERKCGDRAVEEDDFYTSFNKRVFNSISRIMKEEGNLDIAMLGAEYTPDEMGRITGMRVSRASLENNAPPVFDENVSVMRKNTRKLTRVDTGGIDDILSIIKSKSASGRKGDE